MKLFSTSGTNSPRKAQSCFNKYSITLHATDFTSCAKKDINRKCITTIY